jgi:DNA-binding MarR family transcriptional regulator
MLDRLEKAGFIKRKPNPKDRRGILVETDQKWLETVGPIVEGVQKLHHELIASYSDEELEIISDFLTRFTRNVVDYTTMIETDLT